MPSCASNVTRQIRAGRPSSTVARCNGRVGFLFIFALALAFLSTAHAEDSRRTIVFFGDSLTAGLGLENPAAEAYPALIQRKLDEAALPWRAVNAGLSGETTAAGLRRVDWILRQRVDMFVIALGGNDGLRGIEPAVSQQNIEQIIARVRAKYPSAKIVVAGMQMPPSMGQDYTRKFERVFAAVAEKEGVALVPFLLEGIGGQPDLNQPDGIHPTAAGQQVLAKNVWKVIRPLL